MFRSTRRKISQGAKEVLNYIDPILNKGLGFLSGFFGNAVKVFGLGGRKKVEKNNNTGKKFSDATVVAVDFDVPPKPPTFEKKSRTRPKPISKSDASKRLKNEGQSKPDVAPSKPKPSSNDVKAVAQDLSLQDPTQILIDAWVESLIDKACEAQGCTRENVDLSQVLIMFDSDGTLVPHTWNQHALTAGQIKALSNKDFALKAVKSLKEAGFKVALVSRQYKTAQESQQNGQTHCLDAIYGKGGPMSEVGAEFDVIIGRGGGKGYQIKDHYGDEIKHVFPVDDDTRIIDHIKDAGLGVLGAISGDANEHGGASMQNWNPGRLSNEKMLAHAQSGKPYGFCQTSMLLNMMKNAPDKVPAALKDGLGDEKLIAKLKDEMNPNLKEKSKESPAVPSPKAVATTPTPPSRPSPGSKGLEIVAAAKRPRPSTNPNARQGGSFKDSAQLKGGNEIGGR